MINEKSNISIDSENIFPIIKKWLYSDKDIFVRELISNGCDAISKLKRLSMMGEAEIPDDTKYSVKVVLSAKNKTLKFIDNGIGMTAEEVKKYINQVAFSGASDFISKYKDKMDEDSQIIGHFGLGFYSVFMVSEKVEINTLSHIKDSEAVKWVCDGGTECEISESDKTERGTAITLYIAEDSKELLNEYTLKGIINKYCSFMPIEIYFEDEDKVPEENKPDEENKADTENIDNKEEKTEIKPLNQIHPLWTKAPRDCTDEEYKNFYRDVFNDYNEPIFWIHLNVDYPFNLKGILYFPRLMHELDASEGKIKLYNNQVFVADNVKEIIPEFLMLLKGVIDCPDLPLNVSRSFLQKDGDVAKLSKHIVNKVADKLCDLYKNQKEKYNESWNDINPFIKYGCMRDESFYEKVKDILIYKTTKNEYVTLAEYLERNKDKHEKKVFYVSDEKQQAQYIKIFSDHDLEALVLTSMIDKHFINFIEMKGEGVKFSRIDSEITDVLKENDDASKEDKEETTKILDKVFKKAINNDKLKISVEGLKDKNVPAIMLLSEQSRRMQEMSSMFQGAPGNMFENEEQLVLNSNNDIIKTLIGMDKNNKAENSKLICEHIYDLALMSNKQLSAEEMVRFIERSNLILKMVAENSSK